MKTFDEYLKEVGEVGYIKSVVHSVVYVSGLPSLKLREMVVAAGGQRGVVQSLSPDMAEILMLDTHDLANDLAVARTNETFKIGVSESILGRIVNPFGLPIDDTGPIVGEKKMRSIDEAAPSIMNRERVNKPLESGVTIVDLLVPIGYGQRELVIGDKKTGKSTFLLQTIANQASQGVVCVYVSIGKRQSDVKNVENYLVKAGVMKNCCLVVATSADPATMVYLSPLSGLAVAEFFRDSGRNVLIVFDDLSNHSKFYREISLLSKRVPGRASYPGDIFHLHAALLERAGHVKLDQNRTVSITALPVAETLEGDLTGYIQTNLMAITDGHIFFDIDEFRKGQRPAINYALSVSRVGNQTKEPIDRELAQYVRETLSKYKKDLEIARFGVELPEATKREIDLGEKIELIFNQDSETLVPRGLQLVLFGLLFSGFWDEKNTSMMKVDLIKFVEKYKKGAFRDITEKALQAKKLKDLISITKNEGVKLTQTLYV